ncbi:MAG: signal peptidase I [[Eubacterium] siraeum]
MFYTPQYDDIVILYADKLVNESQRLRQTDSQKSDRTSRRQNQNRLCKRCCLQKRRTAPDDYTNTPTNLPENFPNNQDVTVEDGKIFVLGDNRNGSKDSRSNQIGQVDMRYIMGKAYLRIWPLNALGML